MNLLSRDTTCRTLKLGRSVRVWDGVGMATTLNPKPFGRKKNPPPATGANDFISVLGLSLRWGLFPIERANILSSASSVE